MRMGMVRQERVGHVKYDDRVRAKGLSRYDLAVD